MDESGVEIRGDGDSAAQFVSVDMGMVEITAMSMPNVNAGLAASRVWALVRDLTVQQALWTQGHQEAGNSLAEKNPDLREYRRRLASEADQASGRTIAEEFLTELITEEMARPA